MYLQREYHGKIQEKTRKTYSLNPQSTFRGEEKKERKISAEKMALPLLSVVQTLNAYYTKKERW